MNDNFLTVEEARILTAAARALAGAFKREQTKAILDEVREAAGKGLSSLTLYTKDCSDPVIADRLKGLGYTVSVFSDHHDGSSMTINWS